MPFTYLLRTGHVVNVLVEIPAKGNRQCHNSQVLTAPVTPLSAHCNCTVRQFLLFNLSESVTGLVVTAKRTRIVLSQRKI